MEQIDIQALPNQSFSYTNGDNTFDLLIKEANGSMYMSITVNGTDIIDSVRIMPNQVIIPYLHLETGNFVITAQGDDNVYYDQFGVTQNLIYLTASDLVTYRGY